ncbi:MAG: helix-turn-helix domain-containing protein [Vampirovibrionales bacterium]|nr:helix-turn-helix domain-containing protein [Vampirovibrionales bacterium]
MQCPKCGGKEKTKAGFVSSAQRWRCKHCQCQFTRSTPKGRPTAEKLLALHWYMKGQSLKSIAQLLGVSTPAVLKWIRSFGELAEKRPQPSTATVVELDELCTFLGEKNEKFGYGWLFVEKHGESWTGKWVVEALKP